MNVHNPFTTNSVVLECDFNLYKMAKALNNMENEIHTKALSDIYHVRVTEHGDAQFVIKLREEFLGDTVIHFTRNNWYCYVTIARPQINKVMEAGKDMTLKYHTNMKVVKALKRDNRKYPNKQSDGSWQGHDIEVSY